MSHFIGYALRDTGSYRLPDYSRLAALGNREDNSSQGGMIAHISEDEAKLLEALGGVGTTNPRTGLKQFYDGDSPDAGGPIGAGASDQGNVAVGAGGNPGGLASHNQADDAAVAAMSINGNQLSGVNAASDIMAGQSPSFASEVEDYFGINNPGGFLDSNAALGLAGLLGGLFGGPFGAAGLSGIVGLLQGRDFSQVATNALGQGIGAAVGFPGGIITAGLNQIGNLSPSPSMFDSSTPGVDNTSLQTASLNQGANPYLQSIGVGS